MKVGQCKLCYKQRELVESHVWSRFGYKKYASDLSKGGRFVDLSKRETHNRQYTEVWMCKECEARLGKAEDYTAQLLTNLEKQPDKPFEYDELLLRFVTSMSWRTALYHLDGHPGLADEQVKGALKRWRDYLLDKKRDVRPYSQHLFVVFDKEVGLHKGLGGEPHREDGFVLSHIGPLFMVGLLGRRDLSSSDRKVWEASELRPEGGTIVPISEWHVGKGGNVTMVLVRRLVKRIRHAIKIAKEMYAAGKV
jgi:hypothetical protein